MKKTTAIIVTFNPELDVLERVIALLVPQVNKIWLVDNASNKSLDAWLSSLPWAGKLEFVQMSANLGLGAAQNAGLQCAREAGASHVLIVDQDSEPMPDMVTRLLAASERLQSAGIRVAAVAPVYADTATGPASGFVRLGWLGFKKQTPLPGQEVVEADFVISSGSLIPVSVLADIGPMDESLFIDHVDTEWCLRAQSKGYRLFGVPGARMVHTLGDRRTRIWFLRWRNVAYHSPFRYYYIFRNGFLLQKRNYIPLKWKVAELLRCIKLFFYFGLFSKNRLSCLGMMIKGVRDGLRGVKGAYQVKM